MKMLLSLYLLLGFVLSLAWLLTEESREGYIRQPIWRRLARTFGVGFVRAPLWMIRATLERLGLRRPDATLEETLARRS